MAEYICCRSCTSPDCRGCNMYILEKALKQRRFERLKDNNKTIHITADVQSVVRCKECRWRTGLEKHTAWLPCDEVAVNDNWFCADGERIDDVS